jgi:prepilin-type N-terminal cleavage/methylation domain-containing protein
MTISATGNDWRGRAGFTLIELSIAVFIIAIITAVCIPSFVRSYNAAILNETVRAFSTTCQYARIEAVTRQRKATLYIDLERQMFWVSQSAASEEGPAEGQTLKAYEVSRRVALVSAERADEPAKQEKQVHADFYPNGTCDSVTVVFRGAEAGRALAATVDPITARAVAYPVKL